MINQDWITSVLNGKKTAYQYFLDENKNSVFQIFIRYTKSQDEATAKTEECFVEIYNQLQDYNGNVTKRLFELVLSKLPKKNNSVLERVSVPFSHNPSHERMEQVIRNLPENEKISLLLSFLYQNEDEVAEILGISTIDLKDSVNLAKEYVRKETIKELPFLGEECLHISELESYFQDEIALSNKTKVEDHLEFCPTCREVIKMLDMQEKKLELLIRLPKEDENFNERLMQKITPYSPKKTKNHFWKYQSFLVGVIVTVSLIIISILPTISTWTTMIGNYMTYGTIYNVWKKGTYTATDNDITVEINSIEIDPIHMVVSYDLASDIKDVNNTTFNHIKIEAVDSNGKSYPLETSWSHTELEDFPKGLDDNKIFIRPLIDEPLPNEFTLQLTFSLLNGWRGNWEILIPVDYQKGMNEIEVIQLQEVITIDDKVEVELFSLEKGLNGNRLTYDVRFTEEESKRLEEISTMEDMGYFHPDLYHINHVIALVNEENEYIIPINYTADYYGLNRLNRGIQKPYQLTFNNMLTDKDYINYLGEAQEDSTYFVEVKRIHYSDPGGEYTFHIPLSPKIDEPFEYDLDGFVTEKLTVEKN
ncbi:sigma-70 RNA polymerase sigma factor region 4 domain-containing protein [Sutcliffiella rhizosphaerae]|uniref:DUF4179 domain-containing protein n=1 Tax=Sutcliffiella rhizosphaerae TaxID=2880967 RepID=A0ABN8ABR9_9BACI|nr:hypothetical protein [Sutcliffiella rhizosphaerae]CAG9620613.1 hypothetical protein BACCIP111883_01382 [Sutcliffiella rhizosphaerae]